MSWSVYYSGKVRTAKKACRESFKSQAGYYKGTNEGRLLEDARKLVALGLKYNDPNATVSVEASGHAITDGDKQVGQNFSVKVQLVG